MAREKISRVLKRVQWGSTVSTLLILATLVLAYWVAYESYPPFRTSVWRWVDLVGRGVAAVAALGVLTVVALVVWRFWRQVIRPFKWLYLRLLERLVVWPTRDYLDVMVSVESDVDLGAELMHYLDTLPGLGDDAVQVLEVILRKYEPASRGPVLTRPVAMPLVPPAVTSFKGTDRALVACDELKKVGFVIDADMESDDGGDKMLVRLSWRPPADLVVNVRAFVEDELISRGIPLYRFRQHEDMHVTR